MNPIKTDSTLPEKEAWVTPDVEEISIQGGAIGGFGEVTTFNGGADKGTFS